MQGPTSLRSQTVADYHAKIYFSWVLMLETSNVFAKANEGRFNECFLAKCHTRDGIRNRDNRMKGRDAIARRRRRPAF